MEQAHQVYGFRPVGKRNLEWDLNDWKWDGDLFIASSVNPSSVPPNFRGFPVPAAAGNSLNSSSSCSDDLHPEPEIERGSARDLGHKRRVMVDEGDHEEAGPLSLKLGSHFSPLVHQSHVGRGGSFEDKKTKVPSGSSNRAVCQVDDCGFDLSNAKDYHRRHKVCEMHSKATKALVGNVMQRFCQQCSRFHSLQEFDEGKRSCRRRLAGHNKRRRKTQPEPVVGVQSVNDEQASNVLVSLLKILSDMHSKNSSEERMDHNVVGQIVKSFASQSGTQGVDYISGQLHEYQNLVNGSISVGNSLNISPVLPPPLLRPTSQHHSMPASEMPQERVHRQNSRDRNTEAASPQEPEAMFSKDSPPAHAEVRDSAVTQTKLNDFDLNDIYIDPDDGVEDLERSPAIAAFGTGPLNVPTWPQQDSQQSSPPQISGNSDSASAQSPPSSSSGEDQSRTGRIVFKLFGKDPNDFPLMLRGQVLEWLAHSPTDLESYIRPGCVILTIYLRLAEPIWQELSSNLSSSLSRLLDITDDSFWRSGWVYTRVHNQVSFCYNGQIVANTSLPSVTSYCSRILSVSPIAVSMSELAHFQIKGSNLSSPTTRLVCALQGKYLSQEDYQGVTMDDDNLLDDDEIGCVNLSCSIPSVTGRGFIEVENQGLSSSFFPFIIAEQDVCFEIRMLENVLDHEDGDEANGKLEARHQAMDFIHEMGWLLHRYQVNSRLRHQSPNAIIFSFKRFKFLMEFSMDRDWCAVVKKLLDICLEGTVCPGEHPSVDVALLEMDLVHRAVRRNSRSVVELLLHYAPPKSSGHDFLFRPDKKGPAGLTPLHIAAGTDGSESVLDALTDDPGKVGVEAWKTARDSTGSSPEDYARLRGQYAYIHLVQRKVSKTRPRASAGSVVVDVPEDAAQDGVPSFEISRNAGGGSCGACERKLSYGIAPRARVYRPAMLSIVGIAAVCVCVALLFRGSPDVDYVLRPFRWESLEYGSI